MRSRSTVALAVLVALTGIGSIVHADRDDDSRDRDDRPARMRPVTFAAPWQNYADLYGDPTYEKVRFFKDASDVVHLQGLAALPPGFFWTTPVEADGSTVFVLPPRYRPSRRLIVVAAGNCEVGSTDADGKCRVDILPDGRVTVNDTLPSILSLTSITFRVE
jgi:hypothetical protein